MTRRRCLGCNQHIPSGSRCTTCRAAQRAKYHGEWPAHARNAIATHIALHGHVCPGWHRPAHQADDLTLDHHVGVLCRACNTSKRNTGHG